MSIRPSRSRLRATLRRAVVSIGCVAAAVVATSATNPAAAQANPAAPAPTVTSVALSSPTEWTTDSGTPTGPVSAGYTPPNDGLFHLVPGSHNCAVFGTDQFGNQAVHCADTLAQVLNGSGTVIGQVQLVCQNSAAQAVQCAGGQTAVSVCIAGGTGCVLPNLESCGRFGGDPCPPDRFIRRSVLGWTFHGCREVWGEGFDDTIVLPRSAKTIGGADHNKSAGHAPNNVCLP
jgi:hypothetical protein